MEILEYLKYGFVQRALIAGSFIALLCSANHQGLNYSILLN